jgi:hypothetical protein
VGDPALEGDEAAVRVAEEEHLGDVEPFEQQSGTARVLRHVVSAAAKEAAPARTGRSSSIVLCPSSRNVPLTSSRT